MPTQQKKAFVENLEKKSRESAGLIVTTYAGLKTVEFNDFRKKLRPLQSDYCVVKNSLTKIALRNAGMTALADVLDGPTAIIIERGDPLATIKATFDFAKTHENIKIRGGIFEGQFFDAKQLKSLSQLPSKEALIAQLLGTLQAPARNLVSVLQAPTRDLVNVLDAISKKSG